MLKAQYDKTSGTLDVLFDQPLDIAGISDADAAETIDRISSLKSCRTVDSSQGLGGFRCEYEELNESFREFMAPGTLACHEDLKRQLDMAAADVGDGLKVNFHQLSFDNRKRYWEFIFRQGHFLEYMFNRIAWYLAPKHSLVTPFPLHLDLESASTCNMNCPMCYRDQLSETGQMDFDLFRKLVDEGAAHDLYSLRLSWRGETLTHPRICEMIAYAAARIPNVSFLTNAFYITEEIIDCLIRSEVAYIAVSFDGVRDVYETVRAPAKFEQSYEILRLLRKKRDAAGVARPAVRVCTIWPAVRHAPEEYTELMSEVSDYMVCNPYINFKGEMTIKPGFICQYPWERIVVGWDGKVQCCTGWEADDIILGNGADDTIESMWKSSRMQRVRDMHATGRRMELSSCAKCRHGSQGDENADIWDIVRRRY